ncbi:Scr1 family TA system antitoxin-like transcriptional regulator [Streptomyces sp. NPDC058000]|uniref:helix-turn-helix domain-containing protein n=1 Tax=Streptomyces sp. NPDC058000 TaxID=3346299 RepID=UPI0036ED9F79
MAEREDDERLTLPKVLGNELKRNRERRGWSLRDLKDQTTFDHAYLGRVERGEQLPSEKMVCALDELFKTGGTLADILEVIRAGATQAYVQRAAEQESKAERIQVFTSSTIPALMQTEDYARAFIRTERPKAPIGDITEAVEARLGRKRVFDRQDPPPYWGIMDEAALKRPMGSQQVMAAQLTHILKAVEGPNVTIQVMPFDRGEYWMLGGSLTLITKANGATIAYVESFGSGELVESTKRVVQLTQQFDSVRRLALSEPESLELIKKYLEEYR